MHASPPLRNAAHVGRQLKLRRIERGLQLQEVASAAGLSASQLSRIEHGGCTPRVDTLLRLCVPLGVALELREVSETNANNAA